MVTERINETTKPKYNQIEAKGRQFVVTPFVSQQWYPTAACNLQRTVKKNSGELQ